MACCLFIFVYFMLVLQRSPTRRVQLDVFVTLLVKKEQKDKATELTAQVYG